ncbi:MAG: AAA family ATPase [Thermodesulfobacteriota bacterium]
MRIKRFRARDIKAALKMVKDELGPEAVLLSTRQITGDGEPLMEVTAGAGPRPEGPAKPVASGPAAADSSPVLKGLEGGLTEIKELLLDLTHRFSLSERLRERPDLIRLYRELLETGLDPGLARALVEKAGETNGNGNDSRLRLKHQLARLLKTSTPLKSKTSTRAAFLALVGPSGVGKTTTLAKLAAFYTHRERKRVALINLDSFRLGAAEQIRTYARIMGLPVRVAQDKEEFSQAVELFEDLDVVLVDTPSRCLIRPETLVELIDLFQRVRDLTALMVVSAATKDRDLAVAIRRAESLPLHSLIISKIDETDRYGNVINNLLKFRQPVSFLTNGPKVPDDLIPATPARLAELITAGGNATREGC